MSSLRERALEADRLQETHMTASEIHERRAANRKLRRKGTRALRRHFGVHVDRAAWQGDGYRPTVTVEGITFTAQFHRDSAWEPFQLWAFDHRVWDLASLGHAIAGYEMRRDRKRERQERAS